jgi:hypothetical protein
MSTFRPIHHQEETADMSKFIARALSSLFAASMLFTQVATASDCASNAIGKDGKPLAGAAKAAFMKKCEADAKGGAAAESGCAEKAVSKDGKPLAGAAKAAFMKKCEADAKGGAAGGPGCAEKAVSKDGKPLAGAAKAAFMKKCEADAKGGK